MYSETTKEYNWKVYFQENPFSESPTIYDESITIEWYFPECTNDTSCSEVKCRDNIRSTCDREINKCQCAPAPNPVPPPVPDPVPPPVPDPVPPPDPEPNPPPKPTKSSGFCGGFGSRGQPYEICDETQLSKVRDNLNSSFILYRDIEEYQGDPIGDKRNPFTGNFNGNNRKVSGSINNEDGRYTGLFGVSSGEIKNLIVDLDVRGRDQVGGITGRNDEGGMIINSSSIGDVTGSRDQIGGLVGLNQGTIKNSYSTGNIESTRTFNGRSNTADNIVGGLVGSNQGIIRDSYSNADVIAVKYHAGGLVGHNTGEIYNSYATGSVSGEFFIGALVGYSYDSIIENSYAIGDVGNGSGLTAYNYGECNNSYWDTQTSGTTASQCGVGNTTEELQSPTSATGIYSTLEFKYLGLRNI